MLKISLLIVILLGLYLGWESAGIDDKESQDKIVSNACGETPDKAKVFETNEMKRCATHFKSPADKFTFKATELTNKTRTMFLKDLQAQRVRPEDFNVYVSDTKEEGKVIKYDPRLDIFTRFKIRTYVRENSAISNYSVIEAKGNTIDEALNDKRCLEPQLSKLKNLAGLNFFTELNQNQYRIGSGVDNPKRVREDFIGFYELQKKMSWYMFFVGSHNNIENYLLANSCNQSIALVLNHCLVDPSYDMQLEEAFWFKDLAKIGINRYCKSSKDLKWTFISSKVLTKK